MSTTQRQLYEPPTSEIVEVKVSNAILQNSVRSTSAEGMSWESDE